MTTHEAAKLIRGSGGRFLAVHFVKRSTGELRRMTCRLGVTAHLSGGGPAYDAGSHNLITVFDLGVRAYRSVPVEGIRRLRFAGQDWEVTP
jgi:hypothetical protein